MGENRAGDDMVCELWGEIEGDHCYSYLKPPWQLWQWTVAWRPYLGSELALSEYRPSLYARSCPCHFRRERTNSESPKVERTVAVAP
jgi:hypothetical protein